MLPLVWYDDVAELRPGRLATCCCPGTVRGLEQDLASLGDARIDTVFCLLEDRDFRAWGVQGLLNAYAIAGFRVHRHPIRDFGVPTLAEMKVIVDTLDQGLRDGRTSLVHCAAGIGRTGTVTACMLVRRGYSARRAIHAVREHRPGSLENDDQVTFVYDFASVETTDP